MRAAVIIPTKVNLNSSDIPLAKWTYFNKNGKLMSRTINSDIIAAMLAPNNSYCGISRKFKAIFAIIAMPKMRAKRCCLPTAFKTTAKDILTNMNASAIESQRRAMPASENSDSNNRLTICGARIKIPVETGIAITNIIRMVL